MPVVANDLQTFNACDVEIWIEDVGGVYVNISSYSNEVSLDINRNVGEFKGFGADWPTRLVCGKDASGSLKFVDSRNENSASAILHNYMFHGSGVRGLRIYVPDNSPGARLYEMNVVFESMSIPLKADDANPVLLDVPFMTSGEVYESIVQ